MEKQNIPSKTSKTKYNLVYLIILILSLGLILIISQNIKTNIEISTNNYLQESQNQDKIYDNLIVGFGGPIVDNIVECESNPSLCKKIRSKFDYHMSKNFPKEFYHGLFSENIHKLLIGGSALNSIRITNFISNKLNDNKKLKNFFESFKKIKSQQLKIPENFYDEKNNHISKFSDGIPLEIDSNFTKNPFYEKIEYGFFQFNQNINKIKNIKNKNLKNSYFFQESIENIFYFFGQISDFFTSKLFYSNTLKGKNLENISQKTSIINNNENTSKISFMGTISNDRYGKLIDEKLKYENINFLPNFITGKNSSSCLIVIENRERDTYCDLGATEKNNIDFVKNIFLNIKNTKIFYSDAYLINVNFESFEFIYENLYKEDTIISLSMAADCIIKDNFPKIKKILSYLDLIFLNQSELKQMKIKFNEPNKEDKEFLLFLGKKIKKMNKNKKLIIVNTRGGNSTLVYVKNYKKNKNNIYEIPINYVDTKEIIDFNGAGDAFAGGFLTGYLYNLNIQKAVEFGNYLSSEVIKLVCVCVRARACAGARAACVCACARLWGERARARVVRVS